MDKIIFNGVKFGWDGRYYMRLWKSTGPTSLHRAVWMHHNGEIPDGFHVHHIDGNPKNNEIGNLALMSARDHSLHHKAHPYFGTDAHMGQLAKARKPRFEQTCEVCSSKFLSPRRKRVRFCSEDCYNKVWQPKVVPKEPVPCAHCGNMFVRLQRKQVVCSRACHAKRSRQFREKRRAEARAAGLKPE